MDIVRLCAFVFITAAYLAALFIIPRHHPLGPRRLGESLVCSSGIVAIFLGLLYFSWGTWWADEADISYALSCFLLARAWYFELYPREREE